MVPAPVIAFVFELLIVESKHSIVVPAPAEREEAVVLLMKQELMALVPVPAVVKNIFPPQLKVLPDAVTIPVLEVVRKRPFESQATRLIFAVETVEADADALNPKMQL
jgi:hypothetical protein